MPNLRRLFLCLCIVACGCSCVSVPYQRLDRRALASSTPPMWPGEPQFERGKPNKVIDTVGWVLGVPSKIILLDRRMDNHCVSETTEEALRAYLEYNGLTNVKVRVNQYAPQREFKRLVHNRAVGWGWRYSLGLLSWLYGAVLPGRIFGGDNYNPYTDTINLYSDVPAVALHEGGHAKDFCGQRLKGTYACAYMLPAFSLYAEIQASSDVISYLYVHGSADGEKEAYKILFPAMGTYIGGILSTGPIVLLSPWYYAGVVPGHIFGRLRAAEVDEQRKWRPLPEEPKTKNEQTKN